jgi:hypothetical protein
MPRATTNNRFNPNRFRPNVNFARTSTNRPRASAQSNSDTSNTLAQVVHFARSLNLAEYGGEARIIGRWVWIKFSCRPSNELRAALKGAGFRWVKRREEWAHNCGIPAGRQLPYHPAQKYGAIPIENVTEEILASAGA